MNWQDFTAPCRSCFGGRNRTTGLRGQTCTTKRCRETERENPTPNSSYAVGNGRKVPKLPGGGEAHGIAEVRSQKANFEMLLSHTTRLAFANKFFDNSAVIFITVTINRVFVDCVIDETVCPGEPRNELG